MSMGSRALNRQIRSKKKLWCECSGLILKNYVKKTTATKTSLLIRAIQSHCGLLTRKNKTTSDSRAAIS